MPPPRPQKKVAIPVPQGKKKTFDDDDGNFKLDFGSTSKSSSTPSRSSSSRRAPIAPDSDEEEDEDDDDAPEAVGMSAGKNSALRDLEAANRLEMAKKEAAKVRNLKIASMKQKVADPAVASSSKSSKRKASRVESDDENENEDEDEDEVTKRLRARMERAMGAGEGDSEDDMVSFHTLSEGDDEDDNEEMEGSFHTESEEEDEEDNIDEDSDEGEDSDDSETLEEGPIDNPTRIMRERMQAAMEAAERRAGIVHPPKSSTPASSSKTKSTKSKAENPSVAAPVVNEETMWDLGVGTGGAQPLSAEALKRAAEEEKEEKRRKKEKAALEAERAKLAESGKHKTKKRKVTEKTSKSIGEGRKVQLLTATLDPSSGGLPPVLGAGVKVHGTAAGRQSQKKFIKHALKVSGQGPTKNRVDGRRPAVQTRM